MIVSTSRISITTLKQMKEDGKKITMVTGYDYPTARLIEEAGIEMILVGDSLGMVVLGYDSTIPVTLEDMIHHAKAVTRGTKRCLVVGDLPFLSYQISKEQALLSAGTMMKEAGVQAVKLEGGIEMASTVQFLVNAGIPVMGHIGLTPQSVNQLGGYKVQGKDMEGARKLIEDAQALEEAGAFGLVLECVPSSLARLITERLTIPTIGIGAGKDCDGQVLVTHDLLGLYDGFVPKFVKQYTQLGGVMKQSLQQYKLEVANGQFPGEEHSFGMSEELLTKLY